MDRKIYSAPALIVRGSLTARTLQSPIETAQREELDPDQFRTTSNL